MQINNLLSRSIATLMVLFFVSTAYAKVDPKNIEVVVQNNTGFATTQPARALNYSIELLGNNGHSGNLSGQVASSALTQASIWPLDSTANSIVFNLIVKDPAAKNRIIFKGQYYYDLLPDAHYRVSLMIQQSDSHYYVMPRLESPTEQVPALVSIAIQDQDQNQNQIQIQTPAK